MLAKPFRFGPIAIFDLFQKGRVFCLDFGLDAVAPGDYFGHFLGVRALDPLQIDLSAPLDAHLRGGELFVGLAGMVPMPLDDMGVQPLAVGLGGLQDTGAAEAGLHHRPPQGQIGRDGFSPGDVVGPRAGDDAHQGGETAAGGRPEPILRAEHDDRRIGRQQPQQKHDPQRPGAAEYLRQPLFRKRGELGLGLLQGVAKTLPRLLFQNHARRRGLGELVPVAALLKQFHGLLMDAFQLLPPAIQPGEDLFQGEIQAAPGRVGVLHRLPMGVLQGLLSGLHVGGKAAEHFPPQLLVILFERAVVRFELRRGRSAQRGVLLFRRRLFAAIAVVEPGLGLLRLLLRRRVAGGELGLDLPLDRRAVGYQATQIAQQPARHFGRRGVTHRFTSTPNCTGALRWPARRPAG